MRTTQYVRNISCQNPECQMYHTIEVGNIIRYGRYGIKRGRRKRYLCKACGKTFSETKGTVYYRVHRSRDDYDEICNMRTESLGIAAIARIKHLTWNTVFRWLERAEEAARIFCLHMLSGYVFDEVQADEISTFIRKKRQETWIMCMMIVGTRLWVSCLVGNRSYRNIKKLFRMAIKNSTLSVKPYIATDGFKPYAWVINRIFKWSCVYARVVKKYRKGRVTVVDRELVTGSKHALADALEKSEDSDKVNTSFIERLNLTIRQHNAYLHRKTTCHAKDTGRLAAGLDLFRCYYNFIRPHMGLKFGKECWTPAMVAGITKKKLTFRDIFMAVAQMPLFFALVFMFSKNRQVSKVDNV